MSNLINLASLPAPEVIQQLDYETLLAQKKAEFAALYPDYETINLESDPVVKLLEVIAYMDLTQRARENDQIKAVLLPFATGANLENVAADFNVTRLMTDPGNLDAYPPIPPTYETDDQLRRRRQLAPEGLTTAGSEGSYIFHALSAGEIPTSIDVNSNHPHELTLTYTYDPTTFGARIKDVSVIGPEPGKVIVTILAHAGDGLPAPDLLAAVEKQLSSDYVRPFTDQVTVQAAQNSDYTITATLYIYDGPDRGLVKDQAAAELQSYVDGRHKLGAVVSESGLHAALTVPGVQKVELTNWADITTTPEIAPYCTAITLTSEGAG